MNDREMELEDLITSRSGDVLRLKAKADAAMPEAPRKRVESALMQLELIGTLCANVEV